MQDKNNLALKFYILLDNEGVAYIQKEVFEVLSVIQIC